MKTLRITSFIILFFSITIATPSIKVINQIDNTVDQLKILESTPVVYCSIKDLARVLSTTIYENIEREKIVLYLDEHRVKISAGTTFIVIDDIVYQIPSPAVIFGGDIYLPTNALFQILQKTVLPMFLIVTQSINALLQLYQAFLYS